MSEIGVKFNCNYCGEELNTRISSDGEIVECNEFHDCFGEKVGIVAQVYGDKIVCVDVDDFRIELV